MDLTWVFGAYGMGLGASRFGLPPLIGYLIAGMALSAIGMSGSELLAEIGHFGVLFLLFTIGLHLRLRNLLRAEVLGVGALHLGAVGIGLAALALAYGLAGPAAAYVGVALAFSSTVVAAKALEDRAALDSYQGRIVIGILVLQDVVAVALLVMAGAERVSPWAALLLAAPLARPVLLRLISATRAPELLLLYGVALALGGAALFASVGLGEELGALVAGAMLAGDDRSEALDERMWGLKEAFLVAFFLQLGAIGLPGRAEWALALVLLLLLAVKAAGFFLLFVWFRLRARTAYVTAASLASYSEFALIAGAVGVEAGLLPRGTLIAIALATAASFVINALLNRHADALYRRLEPRIAGLERAGDHPDAQITSLGGGRILVVGMGRVGASAYDALVRRNVRVVGLDSDPEKIRRHIEAGRRVIYGDARDPELWDRLEMGALEGVIVTMADADTAAIVAQALRARGFRGRVTALALDEQAATRLESVGVTSICHPLVQSGIDLAESSVAAQAA